MTSLTRLLEKEEETNDILWIVEVAGDFLRVRIQIRIQQSRSARYMVVEISDDR
jgi:hypothetical protein